MAGRRDASRLNNGILFLREMFLFKFFKRCAGKFSGFGSAGIDLVSMYQTKNFILQLCNVF